jgi:hypothetical protein
MSEDDDEEHAQLLRAIKRLQALKLTCTSCGNVRVVARGYPVKLWRVIARTDKLPPTLGMLCDKCCTPQTHFVDWPDE